MFLINLVSFSEGNSLHVKKKVAVNYVSFILAVSRDFLVYIILHKKSVSETKAKKEVLIPTRKKKQLKTKNNLFFR